MENQNNFPRVFLKPREEREIEQGFPWAFDNEIDSVKFVSADGSGWKKTALSEAEINDGSFVEIYSSKGKFLGTGVINRNSKIAVRIFSQKLHADQLENERSDFISKRVYDAVNIRHLNYSETDSCRLIFAEADLIPGLIVERFVDTKNHIYLVVQFLAMACEIFRHEIVDALEKCCKPYGIFERSDAEIREKEGLTEKIGWIGSKRDTEIVIVENGIKIKVDIMNGQKTGYFLDQKDNRRLAASYCKGKRVLDACSHTGGFALNAVMAGAREVTALDISSDACELIKHNAEINGVADKVSVICRDVFETLKKCEADGKKFDVIILDPPAFAKNVKAIKKAYGGYKEINLRAMRILSEGGILVTCSCSTFFDAPTFYEMLTHAARDSHKKVQVLCKRGAGADHPVLLGYPRSEYLKCAVLRVM